jgi:UPF0176 protein
VQDFLVATFYQFTRLDDPASMREALENSCLERQVRGTILLADEGINATIAGPRPGVLAVIELLRTDPRLEGLTWQESTTDTQPFQRLRVRLKKEIVTLRVPGLDPGRSAGAYVEPEDWNELINDPDVIVIDTRNDYEVVIGSFEGAVNPEVDSFSELTDWLDERIDVGKQPRVAMFCTGGIRCEKSTALLRERGIEQVYHLRGGILNYLKRIPESESRWNGACFVFDDRVAVGHGLEVVEHRLCPNCQYPIGVGGAECTHCA